MGAAIEAEMGNIGIIHEMDNTGIIHVHIIFINIILIPFQGVRAKVEAR